MSTKLIQNTEFGGERPLFASHDIKLEDVTIHTGESALKRCSDVTAIRCRFEGKYPFWHCDRFTVEDCTFTVGARAALWYSNGCVMRRCVVDAPKMFREMHGIDVCDTAFPDGQEMLWHCSDIKLRNVKISNCDYLFMHSHDIDIDRYEQHGNYSFQYCKNVVIRNADIHSKDAFWNTENVTVIDSSLDGEYLGWHSQNLTLINCRISGTQPLCYAHNLTMINCQFAPDADLAFEESELNAHITTPITSIKNPHRGSISAPSAGLVIMDKNLLPDSDVKIILE